MRPNGAHARVTKTPLQLAVIAVGIQQTSTAGWTPWGDKKWEGYRKGVADYKQRPIFKMRSLIEEFQRIAADSKESNKFYRPLGGSVS